MNTHSLHIQENISVKPFNTFGLNAQARWYCEPASFNQLAQAYDFARDHELAVLVLGGGSNVLFKTDRFDGLVIRPMFKGINVYDSADNYQIRAGANENWHQLVLHTVERGIVGLENLALIPGTVGACPVQNIGAYGVEVSDFITQVHCWDPNTRQHVSFDNDACAFAYRDSVFKHSQSHLVITEVEFSLPKSNPLKLGYGDVRAEVLARSGLDNVAQEDLTSYIPSALVAEVISDIRSHKLPDPKQLGNVGSFFKNPIVNAQKYQALIDAFPNIVAYPHGDSYKLAAGWLIDQQGFKGQDHGGVAMHSKQALVMVNRTGCATADEVFSLAENIQSRVAEVYGVALEIEPVVIS